MILSGRRRRRPLQTKTQVQPTAKTKDICLSAFSFAYTGAKEKAIKKKTPKEDFALCGARQGRLALDPAAFKKRRAKTLMMVRENFTHGEPTLRESNKQKISAVFQADIFMPLF